MAKFPWHKNRASASTHVQSFLQQAPAITAVLVVVFGFLPMLVVLVVGLAQGTLPSDGLLRSAPGYPFFEPPFWLLWIPGAIALLFAAVSIPVAGAFPSYFWGSRIEMVTVIILGIAVTFSASIAYSGVHFVSLTSLLLVWFIALVLIVIRAALGSLSLVPKAWR